LGEEPGREVSGGEKKEKKGGKKAALAGKQTMNKPKDH